jgi:cellulose synthase/poly-beta-1,6-N-acetylglucosamine synthase-like glycosyltransferase
MVELLFWTCAFGAIYSYFIYPLVLLALPKRTFQRAAPETFTSRVSMIITAHNEAFRIRQKLENTLAIQYPRARLQVFVASDASDDDTDDIVRTYRSSGIQLVRADVRKGKEYAQLLAIRQASGEILVFSDVSTMIPPDAIQEVVAAFADSRVGAVSSEDRFVSLDGKIVGEGIYIRYEMWLRRLETSVNGIVGLSGSFFAARPDVCSDWDISVPSDFNVALNCTRKGYVAISDPRVVGIYTDVKDEKKEYQRKVRTIIRGLSAVFYRPDVLNPLRFGFFAFQVWSHKLLRWIVPWFLILLLISSAVLLGKHWSYTTAFIAQIMLYTFALTAIISKRWKTSPIIRIPYFFVQANAAVMHATLAFIFGRRVTLWEPSKR